jgi:hypothetical protein
MVNTLGNSKFQVFNIKRVLHLKWQNGIEVDLPDKMASTFYRNDEDHGIKYFLFNSNGSMTFEL